MDSDDRENAMRKAAQIHYGKTYPVVTFNQTQQPKQPTKPSKDWTKIEAYRPDLKRRMA